MPEYTSQAQDYSMVAPTHYHPFPEDINPMHGSMGSPSQWPDAPPELNSPVTHLALSDVLWYQPDYQDAAGEAEGVAVNPTVAAAIAACNSSAAEFTNAAAICSAAAAAIMTAGIPAGNACQSAATAILAAGIPVVDICVATAEACNTAAASCFAAFEAEGLAAEIPATGATARRSRRTKSDKVQPSRPPKSSNTGIKKVRSPKAKTGTRSLKSAYAKSANPQAKTGTRSRKLAHAAVKKAQVPHLQTGLSSQESTNAIPETIQTADTQIGAPRTTAKNNPKPAGKIPKAQRKVVTPRTPKKTPQPASHSYNLRSSKKTYNLRSAKKDGTPSPAAIKPNRSTVKKNTRK
ncbi:uncharacterized protein H6S33_005123 [Morchella sextelata]|uniref:uncharacterized protein n=1 Tax=Morchella sextelata TaxID=1174677 RepID=UPI001D042016|nr:uncharacterized protein H6S33_005123 [Morchella sextelata]KAH0605141.1 hypothetical protein H6S33_005123 [Morchella sextelata]